MVTIRRWADCSGAWAIDWLRYRGAYFLIGMLACWGILNAMAGPGVVVVDQVEAEGPSFSDPATLDIMTTVHRNRLCPSQTQRWVWRFVNNSGRLWHDGDGRKRQQAIPLQSTILPFLADDGDLILTLPALGVPDPETGGWMFRSVSIEQCPFLPLAVSSLFGGRMFRSKDIPVNFVGTPHEPGR